MVAFPGAFSFPTDFPHIMFRVFGVLALVWTLVHTLRVSGTRRGATPVVELTERGLSRPRGEHVFGILVSDASMSWVELRSVSIRDDYRPAVVLHSTRDETVAINLDPLSEADRRDLRAAIAAMVESG